MGRGNRAVAAASTSVTTGPGSRGRRPTRRDAATGSAERERRCRRPARRRVERISAEAAAPRLHASPWLDARLSGAATRPRARRNTRRRVASTHHRRRGQGPGNRLGRPHHPVGCASSASNLRNRRSMTVDYPPRHRSNRPFRDPVPWEPTVRGIGKDWTRGRRAGRGRDDGLCDGAEPPPGRLYCPGLEPDVREGRAARRRRRGAGRVAGRSRERGRRGHHYGVRRRTR